MACNHCIDPEGVPCFPIYGLAPHIHKPGPVIGSTETTAKTDWPDNFIEDEDFPGCGVYFCPYCKEGKP